MWIIDSWSWIPGLGAAKYNTVDLPRHVTAKNPNKTKQNTHKKRKQPPPPKISVVLSFLKHIYLFWTILSSLFKDIPYYNLVIQRPRTCLPPPPAFLYVDWWKRTAVLHLIDGSGNAVRISELGMLAENLYAIADFISFFLSPLNNHLIGFSCPNPVLLIKRQTKSIFWVPRIWVKHLVLKSPKRLILRGSVTSSLLNWLTLITESCGNHRLDLLQ